MRNAIGTAPKNQEPIIIEDEVTEAFEKVSWSSAGYWANESGEPTEITPTHWRALPLYLRVQNPDLDTNLDADRTRLDFLVGQVSTRLHPAEQCSRRPRRWIFLAIAIGVGGIALGAHPDIRSSPYVQHSAARLSDWRLTFQKALASLFQRDGRKPLPLETPQQSTTSQDSIRRSALEDDGIAKSSTHLTMASDFQRQQHEIAALKEQLDAARRDVKVMAAQASEPKQRVDQLNKAIEAALAQLQQQRQAADALTTELNVAHRNLQTNVEQLADSKKNAETTASELRREQGKAKALSAELSNARSELEGISAQACRANEETDFLKSAKESITTDLQQERQRTVALTNDVVENLGKYERANSEATEAQNTITKLAAELKTERQKSAALETQINTARKDAAAQSRKTGEAPSANNYSDRKATQVIDSENVPPTTSSFPSSAEAGEATSAGSKAIPTQPRAPAQPNVNPEASRLLARANGLLLQGSITEARIVLDRAAEMGSAQASFVIAETYDPHILSNWKTVGTRPNVAAAREFYLKAAAGGVVEAKNRLESLR